jgi:hypothetical protein
MPLEPDEFDTVGLTLQEAVLLFFKRNRFAGYSPEEVFLELGFSAL